MHYVIVFCLFFVSCFIVSCLFVEPLQIVHYWPVNVKVKRIESKLGTLIDCTWHNQYKIGFHRPQGQTKIWIKPLPFVKGWLSIIYFCIKLNAHTLCTM